MPVAASMVKSKYFRNGAVKKRNSACNLILKHFAGFRNVHGKS